MNKRLWSAAVCVAGSLCGAPDAQGDPIFSDPAGDTFGAPFVSHDISSVNSIVTLGTSIEFIVNFFGPIAAPSDFASTNNVVGYIDIDVDQNAATGELSNKSFFSPIGPSGLGVEFFLDLFSEAFNPGEVDVVDAGTVSPVGTVPIQFGPDFFSVTVPLALLGGDDGLVRYGVIVGDFVDFSDEARNSGLTPADSDPTEPPFVAPEATSVLVWLVLGVCVGTVAVWRSRRPRSSARP